MFNTSLRFALSRQAKAARLNALKTARGRELAAQRRARFLATSAHLRQEVVNESLRDVVVETTTEETDRNIQALAEAIVIKLDERNLKATNKLHQLDNDIDRVDAELLPLEEKYAELIEHAKQKADQQMLGFLGGSTVIFISIARLTWWEYSWDIMEPIAWASQAGAVLFWSYYFFVTKNGNNMEDLADRIHEKGFKAKMEKEGFSIDRYNELVEERKALEIKYMSVKKYQ